MLRRSLFIVIGIALTAPAVSAQAAVPLGGWKVEPSNTQCIAVRSYGSGGKTMSLILKKSLIEESVQVGVLRTGFRTSAVQTDAKVGVGDRSFETTALSYPVAGDKRRVAHLINFDPGQTSALKDASELRVDVLEGVNETFPLGEMTSVWTGLDQCVLRVGAIWNVGEELEQRFEQGPKGDLQSSFNPEDYPAAAIRSMQQGTTGFLILVDEQGSPKDCTVHQTSGSAIIDARSCAIILSRARFSPAIGRDGKPAKSAYRKRITWRLQ